MMGRILRFGCVGVVGFIVDAGMLLALVQLASLPPLPARGLSFVSAATTTFVLNQRFTFQLQKQFSVQRWALYLTTTALGACVNLGAYTLWISERGTSPLQLALGTALGSLLAMTLNYGVSSTLVFRAPRPTPGNSLE